MAFNKTEYVIVDGIFKWCRLVNPEEYEGERFWSATIIPTTGDNLEKVRDLQGRGIMNKMKKDDDGYYIRFKRPCMRNIKGVPTMMDAPKVFDGEKKLIDGLLVGNGSAGSIKLEVYSGDKPRKYTAARLDSLMINHLVEFDPNRDLTEGDRSRLEGLGDPTKHEGW